jgi:hypothetical protein
MNVLASIIESMERLKYLAHMLLSYADIDLPKKSRVYRKPPDLECYFRSTLVKGLVCHSLLLENKNWVRKSNSDEL